MDSPPSIEQATIGILIGMVAAALFGYLGYWLEHRFNNKETCEYEDR